MGRLSGGEQWIRSSPIAHRGLHDLPRGRPENSLAAFEAACQAGYPIELDVRLSRDGYVVVFHDEDVTRLTGRRGRVGDLAVRQLTRLRILGTDERVPTFSETLALVNGRVPLLVELKNFGRAGALEHAVAGALRPYAGPCAVQSFNPRSLLLLRAILPRPRGQLGGLLRPVSPARRLLLQSLVLNLVTGPAFIGYELQALPALPVTVWRRLGLPVLAWTVTSPDDERRARLFADNIIFEGYRPAFPDQATRARTPGPARQWGHGP